MDPVYRFISARPLLVLAGSLLLTLALSAPLVAFLVREARLPLEIDVEKILPDPEDSPARATYDRFRETFGNDETLLVALVTDDVFTRESLAKVIRLTERFESVDGVRSVVSLSNTPDIRAVGEDVMVLPVFEKVPETEAETAQLRERVLGNPLHVGNLVSRDGRAVAFLVNPDEMSEREFRERGIDREVERIAREEQNGASSVIAGTLPVKAATGRLLQRDLMRFVPLALCAMGLVAFATFRSPRGVLVPLIAVLLAQGITVGLLVMSGRTLNLVTFIVPPLVLAVGFAYAVHVVSEHDEVVRERGGEGGPDAVRLALARVAPPVLLTALTTGAGFLSLCTNRLPAIREFGAFCVVGVVASVFAALTFAPAVLGLLPTPKLRGTGEHDRLLRFGEWLGGKALEHRRAMLVAGAVVAALAGVGLTRIEVSTAFVDNLKSDDPLREGIEVFNDHLDGSTTLNVVYESSERNAFKKPENLRVLRELQDWLEAQPEVNGTTSLADFVMVVNRAFHEGDEQFFAIPASKSLISQFFAFVWHRGLESFVDDRFSSSTVLARVPGDYDSRRFADLLDRIEQRLQETAPEGLDAQVTGATPLITWTVDDIARGQAISLSAALGIIYLILVGFFRSFRIAFWALIPNALPVLAYFGILGLSGVTLNVITSLIACIILGIAVDDTIHFLARFRDGLAETGDQGRAVVSALRTVIRPVTSTTIALALGFLVLATSGLRHEVEFGVLAAILLAFAWLVDVTFTPALAAGLDMGEVGDGERGQGEAGGA